jgi:hypothetical protein
MFHFVACIFFSVIPKRGITHSNELSSKYRHSKLIQLPKEVGISLDNLFLDRSNSPRFFKEPSSNDSVLVKEL